MRRHLVFFAIPVLLSGCSFVDVAAKYPNVVGVEMVSIINTDKTIGDHLMSWTYNEDCSTLRANEGGNYCQPYRKPYQAEEPAVYCYRTLGANDCYTTPVATNQRFVGTNEKTANIAN